MTTRRSDGSVGLRLWVGSLAAIVACLAGGLWMIGRLGRFEEPARLFRRDAS